MILSVLSVMPFMVCLFWCVIFLIEYRSLTKAQHVLLSFLGISTALYFCHGQFFIGHGRLVPLSDIIYAFCNIAVFPVFYLYIRRLTIAGKLPWKSYLILLPSVVICLWTADIYIVGGDDVQPRQELRVLIGKIVFTVQLLLVSWFGSKRLRHFNRAVDEFYSNKEDRELRLFGIMAFVMLACALVSTVASSMGREFFSHNLVLLAIPSCIFSAVLFTIAYVGIKQRFDADALEEDIKESETLDVKLFSKVSVSDKALDSFQVQPQEEVTKEALKTESESHESDVPVEIVCPDQTVKPGESSVNELVPTSVNEPGVTSKTDSVETGFEIDPSPQHSSEPKLEDEEKEHESEPHPEEESTEDSSFLRERLMELIEKDKIYLDINLKLTDVASRLYIGRSTLSAFINQHMGMSFSDFINAKRIDHAKNLMKTQPMLSLVEISEKSGFASPSSFYRAFKKYVGVTPKDWMAKGD